MALPQNITDGRAALVSAKAQMDIAVSKAATGMAIARAAGDAKLFNYYFGAHAKLKCVRSDMDAVHSDIATGLIDIFGIEEVGPVILGAGR